MSGFTMDELHSGFADICEHTRTDDDALWVLEQTYDALCDGNDTEDVKRFLAGYLSEIGHL